MKALAFLGLVFFSCMSLAQAAPKLEPMSYVGCTIYHRLQSQIVGAMWHGDCGSGLAEGYGYFTFFFADGVRRMNFMRYKDGKPVSPYAFSSDPVNGNRLIKTNADLSIAVIKDCGATPDRECAAIVNFAYDRPEITDAKFWENQKVKGSYAGTRNYPGVIPDVRTSGGHSPAPAEFLRGSVGVKVPCTQEDILKAVNNPNVFNPDETRACYKEKEYTKYNYYYLTTMDLSCPMGTDKAIDFWKEKKRVDMGSWLLASMKACSK